MKSVIIESKGGARLGCEIARELVSLMGTEENVTIQLPLDDASVDKEGVDLMKRIDEADLIIVVMSDRVMGASGSLKAFLDSYFYLYHMERSEKELLEKEAVIISTRKSRTMRRMVRIIYDALYAWGLIKTYRLSMNYAVESMDMLPRLDNLALMKRLLSFSHFLIEESKKNPLLVRARMFFHWTHAQLRGDWNPPKLLYWRRRGWIRGQHGKRPI